MTTLGMLALARLGGESSPAVPTLRRQNLTATLTATRTVSGEHGGIERTATYQKC
jgi:hypothetical protein